MDYPDYLEYIEEETKIIDGEVKQFTTEEEFSGLAIKLFKEITSIIIVVSSIYKSINGNSIPYLKEEAALIGNLVRYCKISKVYTEQLVKERSEICYILSRSLIETYINIKYFLKFNDKNTLSHYIKNSLKIEKRLLDRIRGKISENGEYLHIEKRMIDSIQRTFAASGFNEDEISNSSKWEEKIKKRLNEIISPDVYFIYEISSHFVHGNWQDLISHHLIAENEGFFPNPEWTYPSSKLIFPYIMLSCDLVKNYSEELLPDSESKMILIERIQNILNHAIRLDILHEQFMINHSSVT
jgi:hypothetical protein